MGAPYLERMELKISRATTLPLLPNVVVEMLRLTDKPEASFQELERVLAASPSLAAKLLRTANSSFYAPKVEVTTLRAALLQLGIKTVRSICLAVSFQTSLTDSDFCKNFDLIGFWKHSLTVACGAKVIACLCKYPNPEEAFAAGLLHDIGKLALALYMPMEYTLLRKQNASAMLTDYESEQKMLGITHQEIGALVARQWHLPALYIPPISKHHNPLDDVDEIDPLTAAVHVANALAYECDMGFSPPGIYNDADPFILQFLEISESQYTFIRPALVREVEVVSKHLEAAA